MAKSKAKKAAALAGPVPKTRPEAEQLLADIGRLQRSVTGIECRMNDRLAEIKAKYEQEAQPLNSELDAKFQALHAWAEGHREELLRGGGKTVHLATGDLSWRRTPPSVRITKAPVVLEALRRLGLKDFIRTKEDVNREAILADPTAVKGVKGISVSQREEFVAKPYESEIEKVEPAKATVRPG